MGGWYDTSGDGRFDFAEIDRWQLDNGGYPGQFENDPSGYGDADADGHGNKAGRLFDGDIHRNRREPWDDDRFEPYDDAGDGFSDEAEEPGASYLDLPVGALNAGDVAAAMRLRSHLSDASREVPSTQNTCYDCAFWRGEHVTTTRAWGCHIFYAIAIEYGGSIPDVPPSRDLRTCSYFAEGDLLFQKKL